jgi:Family of unknown function (DUF5681)
MAEYNVGYGKPPKSGRFRAGVSGNSGGRPKRRRTTLAAIIDSVIDQPIEYQERGQIKSATFRELSLKTLVDRAVAGDIDAAELALKILMRSESFGGSAAEEIVVENWLADFVGQTAEGKSVDAANPGDAEPPAWWQPFNE